jgi:hypothetical protein
MQFCLLHTLVVCVVELACNGLRMEVFKLFFSVGSVDETHRVSVQFVLLVDHQIIQILYTCDLY